MTKITFFWKRNSNKDGIPNGKRKRTLLFKRIYKIKTTLHYYRKYGNLNWFQLLSLKLNWRISVYIHEATWWCIVTICQKQIFIIFSFKFISRCFFFTFLSFAMILKLMRKRKTRVFFVVFFADLNFYIKRFACGDKLRTLEKVKNKMIFFHLFR